MMNFTLILNVRPDPCVLIPLQSSEAKVSTLLNARILRINFPAQAISKSLNRFHGGRRKGASFTFHWKKKERFLDS